MAPEDSQSMHRSSNAPILLTGMEVAASLVNVRNPSSEIVSANPSLAKVVIAKMGEISVQEIDLLVMPPEAGSFMPMMGYDTAGKRLHLALEALKDTVNLPERILENATSAMWLSAEAASILAWGINQRLVEIHQTI